MAQAAVKDTTGYVNYVYNISARGTTEVASQLMGLSGMATNILGQLAFQTSSYLSTTEGALLSMGVVASAGFTKATQQAMEFDQALSTVGAISGKTRGEVASLGDDAMAMSSKFGVAVSEMTQGMESLARAGVSQGNMTAILEEAMGLSKLEGLTLDTAINDLISTTNLLDTQGLDLSSTEYADAVKYQNQKITATSEAAPINAQDIIHTLEHIGGYASSTNLDQDDLYAVIAQLGSKGTKSEMAGTSLRAFISAGQKDTAQRALDRIGLNVKDLWKNDDTIMSISDMKDVLDEAMESRGYTQQEKLEFYSDFAGYKQANQIMKIDTSSVREFKEKIDHSWNMGQKINQVIGTAETHVQGLIQAGTNLLTKVGEPFLPIISTIAFTLKTGIDIINAIPGSNLVIAGGLILASMKAISTIFNKIAPQIVAAKGNIGGIRGLFMGIREDLSETYTLIKNINNADFIQQKARENEARHITDNDKIEYWREQTNEHLYGMFDIKQLELENGFTNDQPYIDWKMAKAKEPIKKTKEPRNQRESSKNPPKGANESSNNRTDNKETINLTNIEKLLTDIKTLMPSKESSKEDTKVTNIEQKIKIDSSIVKDLKNHTFKVVVTNPFTLNRIVPVHEVGSVEWGKQKRQESKVDKLITRQDNIVFKEMDSAGSASASGVISINKKTGRSQQKRTSLHEAGHVLLNHAQRTKSLSKITLDDEDKQILASLKMHDPGRFEKDSRKLIKEFEAELFRSEVTRKTGQTNTAFSQKFLASVRKILTKHNVINEVRFDEINTLSNVLADRSYEYQQKIDLVRNEQIKTEKQQKERPNSHLWESDEKYDANIDRDYLANKTDKLNALRRIYGNQEKRQKPPKPYSEEDRDQKQRNAYDRKKRDVDLRKEFGGQANINDFSDFALLDNGLLTDDKIDQFVDTLNIDFGFDTSTVEGKKSQEFMLQYAKDMVRANLMTGHINLSGQSPDRLKQRVANELHGAVFSFGENKLGSIVASMPDVKTYTTKDLQEKVGVLPNIYYGSKSTNEKLADLDLDYDKIVKNDGPLNGGADYLRALAHFGGVDVSDVDTFKKGGKNYRSKMANKIKTQLDNGNVDDLFDSAELLDNVLSNQIAYHYINDLSSDQQKEFMESVGLSRTGNAYIDMGRYLQKGSSNKDLETIQNIGNIIELDKDKLNIAYGAYRRDLTPGQNVKNQIDPATERAIKMLGIEGFKGVGSHIKKITDAIVELTIQNGVTEVKKEMEKELGRKVSIDEVIHNMPNLHIPHRHKVKHHTGVIDDVGMMSPDQLGLRETIYAGAQQMHDDDVGGNEKWKTATEGGGFQTLQRAHFIPHPDDDGIIFEKEINALSNMDFEQAMSRLRTSETRKALKQTGTAEIEALPFMFEGQQIKGVFKRLPTHGRDMLNTAVIKDEQVLDEKGQPIIGPNGEPLTQPMLQGFLQNEKGDYREAYSWALERRRNRFDMQAEQDKVFGHMALKYGLSRADIMNTPLTELQMSKVNEQYEDQDFVSISQYKKKYDDLYNAATPEQQALMMTGDEALRQLRGQMAAAEKITLDKNGNVVSKGNIFHEWVTPEEYQRRLDNDLIYTEEGNKGILQTKKDKEGNISYKINDFEALHYSKRDIARKVMLEDVLWGKKLEESYDSLMNGTNNEELEDSFSMLKGLSTEDIVEKILVTPRKDIKTIMNALALYDRNVYNDVMRKLQTIQNREISKMSGLEPIAKINKQANLNDAFDLLEKYIPGISENFSAEDMEYIANDTDPFSAAIVMAKRQGLDVPSSFLNSDFTDLFESGEGSVSGKELSEDFNSIIASVIAGDYAVNERDEHYNTLADMIDDETREALEEIAGGGIYAQAVGMQTLSTQNNSVGRYLRAYAALTALEPEALKNIAEIQTTMQSVQNGGLSGDALNVIQNLGSYEDIMATSVSTEDAMSMLPTDAGSGMLLLPPASEEPISTPETLEEGSAKRDTSTRGNVNTATPPDVIEAQRLPLDREAYLRTKAFVSGLKQQALGIASPYNQAIYNRFGNKDNSELENKLGGFSDRVTDTTDQLQGFSTFLQEASETFPPLIGAVLALDGVIGTLTTVQKGTQSLQSFLQIGDDLRAGRQIEFLNNKISSDSATGKMLMSATGMVGEAFETLTTIFWEFLGPIALITAGLIAIKGALDWSYQSHEKYLKSLEEDQKEHRSKVKGLQTTNENAQERARSNRAPRQQAALDRNAQLAQTRLDNANMTRSHGAIEITRQKNDTLWGDYGIAAGLGKLQGNYESTASEYDGTTGQIRRIKEATLANPFSSEAMNQVSSYYDANQLAFGVMDEYKDELGKLYDSETSAMLKYHSDDVRGSPEFNKALDDFVEATGITRDHAKQYLDYMQTEHEVDKATQAMQAQADQISANTELKVQAIAFGGNPADVLGLNGIEAQQGAMIKAQADMIKMELSGQLWWKAVWATITTPIKLILSPLFIITDLLGAIWSFITGNWGDAFDKAGRAGSRLNVFGEAATYWGAWAETEGTDFSAIGQSATDSYNRANYGNVEQPASGGYHPTHFLDANANQDRRESVGGGYSGGQPPRGGYFDHRESQTHYINANRGSYYFMNGGGPRQGGGEIQFNPLGTITGLLSSILGVLVNGLLIGGGIYGLTKLLKSDLSFKALGEGILSTIKGKGSNLLGDIFNVEGIKGGATNILSKFFNLDGIKGLGSSIKDKLSLDPIKNSGIYQKINESIPQGAKDTYSNWSSYIQEKINPHLQSTFSKKKRKGMNAADREFLMNKYGLNEDEDIKNARTSYQKNKLIRQKLDEQGNWDSAMRNLRYHNTIGQYTEPWKEYLGGKVDEKKTQAQEYWKNLQADAAAYYERPDLFEDASNPVKAMAKAYEIKDQIFGKASKTDFSGLLNDPKKFLSDPRNIENMAKDLYSQHKDKLADSDFMATVSAYRERPDIMENAPIHAKLIGKALDWKDTYLQGDSITDVLKDPERTVGILQGTIGDLQNGALDDLNISDEIKEKVSGIFGQIREGAEEGIEDGDEKGGNGGLFASMKSKLAGWFDGGEEEYDWYKNADAISFDDLSPKNKMQAVKDKAKDTIMGSKLFDWYREDPDEEYQWYQNAEAMEFGDLSGKNQLRAILDSKGEALKENGLSSLNTDFGIGEHIQGKISKKADKAKESLNEKIKSGVSNIKGKFKKEYVICQFCGHKNPEGSEFCEECGMPINQDTIEKGKENSKKMLKTQGSLLTQMHMPENIPQNAAQPNAHTNSQNMTKEQGSMLTNLHSQEAVVDVASKSEFEFCNSCGGVVHKDDEFCGWCGARVKDADAYCPECGAGVDKDDEYCNACGTALNPPSRTQKAKQKLTGLLHKFEDKINGKDTNVVKTNSLQHKINKTINNVQNKMAGVDTETTADKDPDSIKNRHKDGKWKDGMLDYAGVKNSPLSNALKLTTIPEENSDAPVSRISKFLQDNSTPKYPKYYDPNLVYKETTPGGVDDSPTIMNFAENEDVIGAGQRILSGEDPMSVAGDTLKDRLTGGKEGIEGANNALKTSGNLAQKAGGFLKGKKGIAGKAGNVLEKIGGGASKAGTKGVGSIAKGGVGKLAKTGIGKAVSGIGKKAIGGIGKKLATKGIAQVGSKVLGGALMATGIGAPLGLLLESPIGGALIEGAMDLGGKALGAIGGAVSGVGNAIGGLLGFGKKTHYQQAGGGKGLGALGALMPGIGVAGMAAGGIGAVAGGVFGLLNGIFKSNKDIKSLNSSMDDHLDKTVKAITDKKSAQQSNNSQGGSITIQNININTADDPEAIKAMFLELLIELQEQVNPRIVSRTVGQAPNNSTTSIDTTSTDSTTNTENTDSTSNTNGTNT